MVLSCGGPATYRCLYSARNVVRLCNVVSRVTFREVGLHLTATRQRLLNRFLVPRSCF